MEMVHWCDGFGADLRYRNSRTQGFRDGISEHVG